MHVMNIKVEQKYNQTFVKMHKEKGELKSKLREIQL